MGLIAMIWIDLPVWVPLVVAALGFSLAAVVAETSYRHLGHATVGDHLVIGSGELTRVRTVLEHDGIIGWVLQQSFFQRRTGLATVVACVGAGTGGYAAIDLAAADVAPFTAAASEPWAATLTPLSG